MIVSKAGLETPVSISEEPATLLAYFLWSANAPAELGTRSSGNEVVFIPFLPAFMHHGSVPLPAIQEAPREAVTQERKKRGSVQ